MKKSKLFISAVAATAALFSAFAPALMNAGETTVWTGDGDFNSWKTVVEIPETAFANAKEGDVVRLTFTDCGATPQVQIAVKTVADWTWTEIVSYDDIVANKYEFTIKGTPTGCDDTLLAMLKAHGVYLKGQDAHLASIQLVSGDDSGSSSDTDTPSTPSTGSTDSVWTGDGDFNSWKTVVEIPETAFANLKEGDTVRLLFGDLGATPQVQIAVKTVADWTWTELVSYDDIVGGKYDLKVSGTPTGCDDTMLAMLKAHGMYLKGQDAHVTGVEIVGAGGGSSSDTDTPSTPSTGSTDSVWTGDGDFNSWKTVVEIPETAFANLKEGDTVRLLFGDLGATPQVQIAVKTVADWTWTELVSYDDIVGGKYDLKVSGTPADCSDTMLAMLKAHGMYLKGQDAHVTGVEIVGAGGGSSSGDSDDPSTPSTGSTDSVWTGDGDFNSWKTVVEIPETAFANLKEGDTVRLLFGDLGATPQVQIAVKTVADWTWTELVSYDDIVGGKYDLLVSGTPADCSDTMLAMLKAHGMYLKGQDAHVTGVEIVSAGGGSSDDPSTPSQGEEIDAWTGDTPFGEWKALIEIPASAFAKASAGDTLRFSFTDCGENPQLQIAIKVGDDWTWTELVSYDDIVGGKYDYKIPADTRADYSVIETLKERGMNMKGQNATPAKMTILTQGGTSAVEFIQTVNVNAPVEIYTLDGRRVNSMEKGIYILRQGNKTMKVIK